MTRVRVMGALALDLLAIVALTAVEASAELADRLRRPASGTLGFSFSGQSFEEPPE